MSNTTLINLNAHAINIQINGQEIILAPSGTIARVSTKSVQVNTLTVNGIEIPVFKTVYGEIENLPEPQDGIVYIASTLLAQLANRSDVVSPDTFNGVIRNEKGQVAAVTRLQSF